MRIKSAIATLSLMGSLFVSCEKGGNTPTTPTPPDTVATCVTHQEPEVRHDSIWGAPFDTTTQVHIEDFIPKNKTLSNVLLQYGLSQAAINQLARTSAPVFDVRKIRPGNRYHIIQSRVIPGEDSLPVSAHFIYEINASEYVVYDLRGSEITAKRCERPLQRKSRLVKGEIETSLWNAVVGQGIPFALALELSNIYAWNIDFFGLQKGDHFTVKYDEIWCDSTFIRIDTIYGARFNHCGVDFHAIPFVQNNRRDYFDYEGNSLRKAFLKAPLSYSRISSHFSHSRFHPVLKYYRPHHGVDYAAPSGTPVSTIGDGKVIYKGYSGGGGNTVKIQHNSTYTTVYMHLSKFGKINVGSFVKQGEVIGLVGSTGTSTGPHLDFRVYENGKPIDPLKLKSPPVEPVDSTLKERFNACRDSILEFLK